MKTPIVAVLALFSSLCASAFAENRVYLGASCQEDAAGESGAFKRNEAEIRRVSAIGSGRLICPIVRSETGGSVPLKPEARISVTDYHPTLDVTCAISVRNHNGTPVSWKSQATTGAASNARFLYFPKQDAGFDLPLSIECVLPPPASGGYYTSLHSYRAGS